MKRCPECRRDYFDDTLYFCLDDGAALVDGPGSRDPALPIRITDEKTFVMEALADGRGRRDENETELMPAAFTAETQQLKTKGSHTGFGTFRLTRSKLIIASLGIVMLAVAGFGLYKMVARGSTGSLAFKNTKITKLTTEGNVDSAVISPDGKYIAYVTVEGSSEILWTMHLATSSRVKIAEASEGGAVFAGEFSPDGNYVYYVSRAQDKAGLDLFQVPVLGGNAKKIVQNISMPAELSEETAMPAALSADGKMLAFLRLDPASSEMSLNVSASDGTAERAVAHVRSPEVLGPALAWSPDGKTIAADYYLADGNSTIALISVADGTLALPLSKRFNSTGSVRWMKDGNGLLIAAQEQAAEVYKLWHLDFPPDEVRLVTNDVDAFALYSLSLTAENSSMLAVQNHRTSSVYVSAKDDPRSGKRISSRIGRNDGIWGLSWDRGGRLFSVSQEGAKSETWMLEPGAESPKLVMEESVLDTLSVTPDGHYFVFISKRSGTWQIWRANSDGTNFSQLTFGDGVPVPGTSVSPDGKWVFFTLIGDDNIYRIPLGGGDKAIFVHARAPFGAQMSPDGSLLAFVDRNERDEPQIEIEKVSGATTTHFKTFPLPKSFNLSYQWYPDGRSLVYCDLIGRVSNLWQLPLSGEKPRQLTDFASDLIQNFAFSPDGKQLAIARGPFTSDAVLLTDSK